MNKKNIHENGEMKEKELLAREKEKQKKLLTDTILSNLANGVTAIRLDGDQCEYLYSNDQFYKILKYTREDFAAKKLDIYSVFHPDDRGRVRNAVENLKPEDGPLTIEYRAICGDASIVYIRMVISVIKGNDEEGDIQVSIFEDITNEVCEEERRRELMDNLPCGAGIYDIVDHTLTTIYVNKKYKELVQRDGDRILEASMDVVLPEDKPYVEKMLSDLVKTGKEQEYEVHLLVGKDQYKPFLIHVSLLKTGKERTTVSVTYNPISEEEITFRNMLPVALETMMAASNDLSFIKDRALTYVCASREFARMVGYENEKEIIGKTDYDLFSRELAEAYRADDQRLLKSGESLVDSIERIPARNGKICYSSTSKYLLRDDTGNIIGIYGTGRDITEDREAYKRLQMLTDTIPGGLVTYEFSPEGARVLFLSDGVYTITGYSKEEYNLANRDPLSFIIQEDIPELQRQIAEIMKNDTPINDTFRLRRKDGTHRWVNYQAMVAERNGDRLIVNAVLFDVNEQKESSLKLAEAERQNRMKYEHELHLRKELIRESVIYYQLNLTTGVIEEYENKVNKSHTIMVGKNIDDSIHSETLQCTHPDDLSKVFREISPTALLQKYKKGENSVTCVYRRKLEDDEYRFVKTNAVIMTKPNTQELITLLYCYDIDREWKDHIAIETLLDEDMESIFHIDVNKGIAYVAHMRDSVNYVGIHDHFNFKEECEKLCERVIVKEDREIFLKYYNIENLTEYLSKEPFVSATYRIKENNGIHKKLMTAYYMDKQKSIIVVTRRDITKLDDEEQRQKEALQIAVEQAARASKAKSDFLSHMSHDMRTPLNAVLAYSNPELIDHATTEQLREYLYKVNLSGDYLLGIINDVLDMSRIEQNRIVLNPEPYYLSEFEGTIRNVIGELSREKDIEFVMKVPSKPYLGIVVDKVRLNQIFINLLSNAVKFTPYGGKVEFLVEGSQRLPGHKVLCTCIVRDNGIGMSKEFIPHAFESFNQEYRKDVMDKNQGTGLGLPIVKSLSV